MKQTRSIGRDLKVSLNIEKMLSIREELKKKYVARVGVLGQKTNRIPMLTGENGFQRPGPCQRFGAHANSFSGCVSDFLSL